MGVPRRLALRFAFDRDLDPRSVSRNSVALVSGDQTVLLTTRYDVVDRAVDARPFRGGALAGNVRYRAVLHHLRAIGGGEIAEPLTVAFHTASEDNPLPPDDPPVGWSDVGPLLRERCADAGCHGGERPAMGLRLDGAEGVRETALGVPSIEAPGPRAGDSSPGVLSARPGMTRIDLVDAEGRPELSYLLLKVIGHSWILGERMPLGRPPLGPEELRLLQSWIRHGAPVDG